MSTEEANKWIISVRKLVTAANPKITVAQIMGIFHSHAPTSDTLAAVFMAGRSPEAGFAELIDKHGKIVIGFTEDLPDWKPCPEESKAVSGPGRRK